MKKNCQNVAGQCPISSLFNIISDKKYPIAVSRVFFMYDKTQILRAQIVLRTQIVAVQILRETAMLQSEAKTCFISLSFLSF